MVCLHLLVKEMGKPVSPWGTEVIEMHAVVHVPPSKGSEGAIEIQNARKRSQSSRELLRGHVSVSEK